LGFISALSPLEVAVFFFLSFFVRSFGNALSSVALSITRNQFIQAVQNGFDQRYFH